MFLQTKVKVRSNNGLEGTLLELQRRGSLTPAAPDRYSAALHTGR